MNTLSELIKEWIEHNQTAENMLDEYEVIMSEDQDVIDPPHILIAEVGSETRQDGGVQMDGVEDHFFEITLVDLPVEELDGGTLPADHRKAAKSLSCILRSPNFRPYIDRHGWRVFDIRVTAPQFSSNEGRRGSTSQVEITALEL